VPPLILYLTARLLFPDTPLARGNSTFWGAVILGSILAAAAVYRHKRIPLWLAAVIGPVTVLLLALASIVWWEVQNAA
jgi:peptidoglycan/LPS O-acetylase OafA/YrhL